jgi:PhzF family phenazine biosynthesis protein
MKIKLYQIDAFANKLFSGNPAAVCPLEEWLPDDLMQQIAEENNLAETAFFVKEGEDYRIRWFTPTVEVDLCGHATLATAHVLFAYLQHPHDQIRFASRSGVLRVTREQDRLTLDFPADQITRVEPFPELKAAFPEEPQEVYKGKTDYMLVFGSEAQILDLQPDFRAIARIPARGVIVTAKGEEVDFVSRFFGPQSGIDEDPATGSAHTTLTPYWAERLGKNELTAVQLSPRRGYFTCTWQGERVAISGQARTYMIGEINF